MVMSSLLQSFQDALRRTAHPSPSPTVNPYSPVREEDGETWEWDDASQTWVQKQAELPVFDPHEIEAPPTTPPMAYEEQPPTYEDALAQFENATGVPYSPANLQLLQEEGVANNGLSAGELQRYGPGITPEQRAVALESNILQQTAPELTPDERAIQAAATAPLRTDPGQLGRARTMLGFKPIDELVQAVEFAKDMADRQRELQGSGGLVGGFGGGTGPGITDVGAFGIPTTPAEIALELTPLGTLGDINDLRRLGRNVIKAGMPEPSFLPRIGSGPVGPGDLEGEVRRAAADDIVLGREAQQAPPPPIESPRHRGGGTMNVNGVETPLDAYGRPIPPAPAAPVSSVEGVAPTPGSVPAGAGTDIPPIRATPNRGPTMQPPSPPAPPTGGVPPSGATPPPAGPSRVGIKNALAAKEEALREPGSLFGPEGSLRRAVAGVVNPSVDLPRNVHVAYNARAAVNATEYTNIARKEIPAARELRTAFDDAKPAYSGPADNPFKNTVVDWMENPDFYQGASPRLTDARDGWKQAGLEEITRSADEFGVDIHAFSPKKAAQGAVYVPHFEGRDVVTQGVDRYSQSLAKQVSVAKERGYETLYERWKENPAFTADTDIESLADRHASALSFMAANNTFREGAGGLTRNEVLDKLHPKLRQRRDSLANNVANMRKVATHHGVGRGQASALEKRAEMLRGRIDDLGDEYGPELSHLAGQLYEVAKSLRGTARATVNRDMTKALADLEQLRKAVRTADLGDYVLSPETMRYHTPAEARAIQTVLKSKVDNAFIEGTMEAADLTRAAALGPDFSPLTIQGALGALSHPEVAIKNAVGLVKAAFTSPQSFFESLDPALVSRYELATGRRVGQIGPEFQIGKTSIGGKEIKLPGRPIKQFNDALTRVVEYGRLKAFENDSALLMRLGEQSQNVADHEAANMLSKMVPQLNTVETGRSVQRARLERFPVISPSFTAGPFLFAKDFASGLAKVTTLRPGELLGREKLALLRGTTMIGTMTTASVASALLSAESNNLTPADAVKEVLDPNSPRFMHVVLGDKGSVALGGPHRSAFLGAYRTSTQGPKAGVKYARGRANPGLGSTYDIAVNRDWRGRPIRQGSQWDQLLQSVQHMAQNSNLLVGGAVEGGLTGAATQLTGTNYFERTPYDETDSKVREEVKNRVLPATFIGADGKPHPIKTYQDLVNASPLAAEEFDKRNPDLAKQRLETARPETLQARKLQDEFTERQEKRDATLLKTNPAQWRAESSKDSGDLGVATRTIYSDMEDRDATGLRGVANDKYSSAIEGATVNGQVNWDQVDKAVAAMLPEERRLLFETRLRGETDARKRYIEDLQVLTPYFEQRDLGWQEIKGNDPNLAQYDSFDSFRQQMITEVHDAGIGWTEARNKVDEKLEKYSEAMGRYANVYLAENADGLLPLLDKYDFYIPARFQKYVRKAA